jgi:hypothetical protein
MGGAEKNRDEQKRTPPFPKKRRRSEIVAKIVVRDADGRGVDPLPSCMGGY